jgi:hypothetical protein
MSKIQPIVGTFDINKFQPDNYIDNTEYISTDSSYVIARDNKGKALSRYSELIASQ